MDNCKAIYTLSVKLPCFPDRIDYLGQVHVMIMLGCSESGDFMACQDICVKHIDKSRRDNWQDNWRDKIIGFGKALSEV